MSLSMLTGVEFDTAWHSKIPDELDGVPVHFIPRDLLIQDEKTTGRAKDLADVEAMGDGSD